MSNQQKPIAISLPTANGIPCTFELPHDSSRIFLNDRQITDISQLDLTKNPNLTDITLSYNQISDVSKLDLTKNPNLTNLCVSDNQISDASQLDLTKNTQLKTLYLTSNKISDVGELDLTANPELRNLYLSDNQISDVSGLDITNNPELKHLHLSGNQITDISQLDLTKNTKLLELYLDCNKITDVPQEWLNSLPQSVGYLNIHGGKGSAQKFLDSPEERINYFRNFGGNELNAESIVRIADFAKERGIGTDLRAKSIEEARAEVALKAAQSEQDPVPTNVTLKTSQPAAQLPSQNRVQGQ